VLLISGCGSDTRVMNLSEAKNRVQNYYESGEFEMESKNIIDCAINYIEGITLNDRSAVVFDVDETALSNYQITKETGFGFIPDISEEWQLKGIADALPQTKRFYDYLVSNNIHVIFLTGRQNKFWNATYKNLIDKGFLKFDTLIVRETKERDLSASEFKGAKRMDLVRNGYDIIASAGDQWSDFAGGNCGYKIKLPNYLYLID